MGQPGKELLDGGPVSFRLGLDGAIGTVADPAGQSELIGRLLCVVAESDALNPSRDNHVDPSRDVSAHGD